MGSPLLAVDGFHLLYRSWWGFSDRRITSRDGSRDLTGVFGFFAILRKTHREMAPDHEIVVAFDGEYAIDTRQAVDARYKADRAAADHTAIQSLQPVKDGLDALGISWIELDDREGDDVLATLTSRAVRAGRTVTCYSGDRDLLQLVDHDVTILNPARRWITPEDVYERYRVFPWQWPDYRALTGDPTDNIPGVRGVGPKTAAALLADGWQLEDLLSSDRLDRPRCRTISAHWDRLLTWRDLILLDRAVQLPATNGTGNATPPLPLAARILDDLDLW